MANTVPIVQTLGIETVATIIAANITYAAKSVASPGDLVKVADGSVTGRKIPYIQAIGEGSTSLAVFQIWIEEIDDSIVFFDAYEWLGSTVSTTVLPHKLQIKLEDLILKENRNIWVGISVFTNNINVLAPYGDY